MKSPMCLEAMFEFELRCVFLLGVKEPDNALKIIDDFRQIQPRIASIDGRFGH